MGCLLALGSLAFPLASRAADPAKSEGQRHLAETLGGLPNDFELVYERRASVAETGSTLWAAKYLDHRTGEIHAVYRDDAPGTLGTELYARRVEAAEVQLPAVEVKADDELLSAVAGKVAAEEPQATVPVGVWLEVDVTSAEQAVIDRHPELVWDGGRPLVDDLETARIIRAELAQARADARAGALEQLRTDAEALGGSVGYVSTSAPLAYVDLPAARVDDRAANPDVSSLGLERTWATTMSSAGPAVQGNWTGSSEDQGAGVRVAVVEYHNVRNSGDLSGRVVASHSASGSLAYTGSGTFDHPTWVAGAIAGRSSTYPGVAPGAVIVSSSTGGGGASVTRDRQIIAAADWAASSAGGDADVVNASIGQDTATGSEEARRYFDALVHEDGRLAVAAAGNYVTFGHWDILSPGTAYNALTVGGIDDRGTAGRGDDRIWYYPGSNGSSYRDRTGTAWNAHGDFNKPNVSAPAPSVRTANGLAASGTSVASPIVAGIAAQVISNLPSAALRPEATRAIIMAGAINRSPMPDGSRNSDHEGTGTASALWANRLLAARDTANGGHRMGSVTRGQTVTQDIQVVAGQKVKVVLTWNSHTSGSSISTRTDRLTADLDLRIVQPNGSASGSFTFDNNYEWVEFTAAASGTARLEIRQTRFESPSERYGLAWAKWSIGTPIRLAGADRFATAATVSSRHFGVGAPIAYVATGRNFPDALAAGAAAGAQGGPILLTEPSALPKPTRDELSRLRPQRIVVLGGTAVVSQNVLNQLDAYTTGSITRLAGSDRYATAAAVSRATFAPVVPAAFIATGESFPDALSAGPAAIRSHGPVLLTARGTAPQALRDELQRLQPQRIYLLGGTSAVTDGVKQTLQGYTGAPIVRLAGADRFATAVAVSRTFFSRPPATYLATGMNFPDALSAVPAAGRAGTPLLLVGPATVPAPVRAELTRLFPPRCYLIGGTAVIGNAVVNQLNGLLGKP